MLDFASCCAAAHHECNLLCCALAVCLALTRLLAKDPVTSCRRLRNSDSCHSKHIKNLLRRIPPFAAIGSSHTLVWDTDQPVEIPPVQSEGREMRRGGRPCRGEAKILSANPCWLSILPRHTTCDPRNRRSCCSTHGRSPLEGAG